MIRGHLDGGAAVPGHADDFYILFTTEQYPQPFLHDRMIGYQ